MSGLFLLYLALSFGLVGIVALLARDRGGNLGIVCGIAAVAVFGAGCLLFSPGLIVQTLLTIVLCAICGIAGASRKVAIGCAAFAAIAGLSVALGLEAKRLRAFEAMRTQYPLVSLDDRLAYEKRHLPKLDPNPVLSTAVEAELALRESRNGRHTRTFMLQRLHNRSREQFEGITGAGAIRMNSMLLPIQLELPDEPPVPQPKTESQPYDPADDSPGQLLARGPADPAPEGQHLVEMHNRGLRDFLDNRRMGYIDPQGRVAGFASHRFAEAPTLFQPETAQSWETTRLELVGLLVYDEPVAYVTEHLPRLEEMQKAATRELDEFEKQALAELRTEKDIVTEFAPHRIRMLGALRAGKDCLECHNVPRGHLLGAFSYILRPAKAPADTEPPKVAAH